MPMQDQDNEKKIETQTEQDTTDVAPKTQANQMQQEPDYRNLFLRVNADFQNYRKRIEKERGEWSHIVQGEILVKIIPIFDDLERALQATTQEQTTEKQVWIEGFALIAKNFKKCLSDVGIAEIPTTGLFNPEFHEALVQVESSEHQSGIIVQTFAKGYTFQGKVIKHAQVSVAK